MADGVTGARAALDEALILECLQRANDGRDAQTGLTRQLPDGGQTLAGPKRSGRYLPSQRFAQGDVEEAAGHALCWSKFGLLFIPAERGPG